MKPTSTPQNPDRSKDKGFLRRAAIKDRRFRSKLKNTKRLRIYQSVQAGHVRGGHSFH